MYLPISHFVYTLWESKHVSSATYGSSDCSKYTESKASTYCRKWPTSFSYLHSGLIFIWEHSTNICMAFSKDTFLIPYFACPSLLEMYPLDVVQPVRVKHLPRESVFWEELLRACCRSLANRVNKCFPMSIILTLYVKSLPQTPSFSQRGKNVLNRDQHST